MRANNLTISIPSKGCDKNPPCPYCVSKITGGVETNLALMERNIKKVLLLAKISQVSSVLLTGKGEPFLSSYLLSFIDIFKEFSVEVQTNGIWLNKNLGEIKNLYDMGLNVIAISVDNITSDYVKIIAEEAHKYGIVVRVTFNITNMLPTDINFLKLIDLCKNWSVNQMTLRNITTPNHTEETDQSKWIKKNVDPEMYNRLIKEFKEGCREKGFLVRSLPYGAMVYDYFGLSVSYSDYCIQDKNNSEDIRSLIFQEDGHLYTSWNSKASILF